MDPEKSFYAVLAALVSPPGRLEFPAAHLSVQQTKKRDVQQK